MIDRGRSPGEQLDLITLPRREIIGVAPKNAVFKNCVSCFAPKRDPTDIRGFIPTKRAIGQAQRSKAKSLSQKQS